MSKQKGSYKEVISLAYPAVLTMLSWTVMWTVDTIFVGRVGTAEQGAVGFAGTLVWVFACFVTGTIYAVQIFVAQHCGANQKDRCGEMLWQGIYMCLIFAVPMGILGLNADRIVGALKVSPEIAGFAATYFQIRILGVIFTFLFRAQEVFLQGTGDTKTPLKVSIMSNGLNVALDYLLIFGKFGFPEMGVGGAALATVIATAFQSAAYAYVIWGRADRKVYFRRSVSPLMPKRFVRLLRVGSPQGIQWLLDMGTWTIFTTVVARMGEVEAAAHQIALTILHISFMPGYGVSIATTTLVGQYLGAGDKEAARRSAYNSLRVVIAFMGSMGILFYLFRTQLIGLFNPDPAVVAVGATLLVYAAIFQAFDGAGMVCSGTLRGAGDTRWPSVVSIAIAWGVFVPLVYLMPVRMELGVVGGWQAAAIWIGVLGIAMFGGVRRRKWADRELVSADSDQAERAPSIAGTDAASPRPPSRPQPELEST
jgi:MATE family multidrug resistance protein